MKQNEPNRDIIAEVYKSNDGEDSMEMFKVDANAIRISASDVITQSEIMTRAACPRKWYYRYALRLDKRGAVPSIHLIYGSIMHAALAKMYKEGTYVHHPRNFPIEVPNVITEDILLVPGAREEMEFTREKVQIAFDAYRWHYHGEDNRMEVISTERDYNTTYRGIKLSGRIDLVARPKPGDGEFIWDFKTAGRFDAQMLDAWSFRFQFLFYCWLYWRCTGVKPDGTMANGLAKTLLKPSMVNKKTKEKESKEAYLARVKDAYWAKRSQYFYRQRMPLQKGMLERFETEILGPHITTFKMLSEQTETYGTRILKSLAMSMNTGHCHVYGTFCEFLPLCKDGPLMLSEYDHRKNKHVELVNNEAEIGES